MRRVCHCWYQASIYFFLLADLLPAFAGDFDLAEVFFFAATGIHLRSGFGFSG